MNRYSVDSKVEFNKKNGGIWGKFYALGVKSYRDYSKLSASEKKSSKEDVDHNFKTAKKGNKWAQAFVTGYRDAANERKSNRL